MMDTSDRSNGPGSVSNEGDEAVVSDPPDISEHMQNEEDRKGMTRKWGRSPGLSEGSDLPSVHEDDGGDDHQDDGGDADVQHRVR